jgi:hypothetical protein
LEVDDEAHLSTQIHGRDQGKTPPNSRMKNQAKIQLGDLIQAQRLAILRELNIYKVWKLAQYPPTLWRIGGISHSLISSLTP